VRKRNKRKRNFGAWVGVPSIRMKPVPLVYYGNEFSGSVEQGIIS